MLKIKMYRSAKMQKTDEVIAYKITVASPPEEMTDEERKDMNKGQPMLTLWLPGDRTLFVPPAFIIEVTSADVEG